MTIQMKATKQCFPVVLFITLNKVVLKGGHSNESYQAALPVVLFITSSPSLFSSNKPSLRFATNETGTRSLAEPGIM